MKKAILVYQMIHTIVFSVVFLILELLEIKDIVIIVVEILFYTGLFYLVIFSIGKVVEKSNKEKVPQIRLKSLIFNFFRALCVLALTASIIAIVAYFYLNNVTGVYYREIFTLLIFLPAPLTILSALKYLVTVLDLYHMKKSN